MDDIGGDLEDTDKNYAGASLKGKCEHQRTQKRNNIHILGQKMWEILEDIGGHLEDIGGHRVHTRKILE